MKNLTLLTCAALICPIVRADGFFVGAGGNYTLLVASAEGDKFNTRLYGPEIQVGYSYGKHDLGVAGQFLTGGEYSESTVEAGYNPSYYVVKISEDVDISQQSVKLFYHYNIPAGESVSFYVGPSVGLVRTNLDMTVSEYLYQNYQAYYGSSSATANTISPCAGIDLGTKILFSERASLNIGYKFLWVKNSNFDFEFVGNKTSVEAKSIMEHQVGIQFTYKF